MRGAKHISRRMRLRQRCAHGKRACRSVDSMAGELLHSNSLQIWSRPSRPSTRTLSEAEAEVSVAFPSPVARHRSEPREAGRALAQQRVAGRRRHTGAGGCASNSARTAVGMASNAGSTQAQTTSTRNGTLRFSAADVQQATGGEWAVTC